MKFNKYFKIFVVCFCLVSLLTVSCFATSAQTTSTTAVAYGHYISPGEYVFDEVLDNLNLSSVQILNCKFVSNGESFTAFVLSPYSSDFLDFYYDISLNNSLLVYREGSWVSSDYRTINILEGFYIYDSIIYQWWQSNATRVSPGYESNLLDGFLSAFTMIGQWISGAANTLTSMFWSNNSLTFLGTLAVSALAFAVAFLIIGLISRFLRFRG